MATLRVKPLPDGVAMRGNWELTKNRARQSTHTQKNAAVSAARSKGSTGDTVVVHGVNGEIQRRFTLSGSSNTGNGGSSSRDSRVNIPDSIDSDLDDVNDLL